jgi:hypothetical protein
VADFQLLPEKGKHLFSISYDKPKVWIYGPDGIENLYFE